MNSRLDYIDILKGIGILFVIIGHMYTVPECKAYVYSFHLPLFFIISGALLNESKYSTFKDFFISRFKSLFFPFMVFYIILWLGWFFVERPMRSIDVTPLETAFGLIWASDSWRWIFPGGLLWFVPALFSLEVIYYGVIKAIKNRWIAAVVLTALFAVGLLLAKFDLFILPWGINNALISIPFLAIGHLFRNYIINPDWGGHFSSGKMALLLGVILLIISFWGSELTGAGRVINISRLKTGPLWIYLSFPFIGTASWLFISKSINKNRVLQWFGKNTLPLLAFHGAVGRAAVVLVGMLSHADKANVEHTWYLALATTIITILVCWPLCVIWNKYYPIIKSFVFKPSSTH